MMQASTKQQLKQYIERAEKLEEEVGAIKDDLKNVFIEAKANGFDPKIMKKVIALRKKDKSEIEEEAAVLDVYLHAVGMAGTPMGDYIAREDEAKAKTIARAHGISESVVDELVARAP